VRKVRRVSPVAFQVLMPHSHLTMCACTYVCTLGWDRPITICAVRPQRDGKILLCILWVDLYAKPASDRAGRRELCQAAGAYDVIVTR
jgi:hypothetical protein